MIMPFSKVPLYIASALSRKCWYLIFHITTRCNQKCRMCFSRNTDKEQDDILNLGEIKRIAPHLTNLFQFTLSGGEPILREDLPDIVKAFNVKKTIPRITIPSNGYLPDKLSETIQKIAMENQQSNINVALSLDGIGEHHDEIRGARGAFEKFLKSMKEIQNLSKKFKNITLVVASTISNFNQNYADEILNFIEKQPNPEIFGLMLTRGLTREKEAIIVDKERFISALEKLMEIQRHHSSRLNRAWTKIYHQNRVQSIRLKQMIDPCKAGNKLLILTHDGFLWPCEILQWDNKNFPPLEGGFCFGNVRDANYNIEVLLSSRQTKKIKKYISRKKCHCTFECAMLNNFALNPINYFHVLKTLLTRY